MSSTNDQRHHVKSMLMRESLVDKEVMASTDEQTPIVRMLPNVHIVKIGGRSILEAGHSVVSPLIEKIAELLQNEKLVLGVGGGARSRHVFSVGLDLGLPTGVLAQVSVADALGNANILATLLAPYGVVATPPELFGHLLPFFIHSAPGVIYNGVPPYGLWEHPPSVGRIPPHRTDAGCVILGECFGCKTVTLVKDVKGIYTENPHKNPSASLIDEIGASELEARGLETLPFDPVVLSVMKHTRLLKQFQLIDGREPELLSRAIKGEHVGTIVHADA